MITMSLSYQVVIALYLTLATTDALVKYPIVLVPGYTGSQLEARLNKTQSRHAWCPRYSESTPMWMAPLQLMPFMMDCWQDNMRLTYNRTTRRTVDTDGVIIRPKLFGDPAGIRYVTSSRLPSSKYFDDFISALELRGYRENVDLKAAPYDWRKAPYESETWMVNFKNLMERTRRKNNRTSIIVCHSYGCPFVQYFLTKMVDPSWKATNVRALVAVAGAWGGHFKSLYRYIGDDHVGLVGFLFPGVRQVERTFSSASYMLPQPNVWKDHVLVSTSTRNYTAYDYEELFTDMKEYDLLEKYRDAKVAWGDFEHPGTDLYCFTGTGFAVADSVQFEKDGFVAGVTSFSKLSYGEGDGRIARISMRSCLLFESKRSDKKFVYEEMPFSHMGIVQERTALDRILQVIKNIQ